MTELCSTCSVFEVCSCVRTCVRRVRVDSLVKGTCVRAFEGTRSRNTEILCSSVFRVREQLSSIVEDLIGHCDSIFSLSGGPQLHFGKKKQKSIRIALNL